MVNSNAKGRRYESQVVRFFQDVYGEEHCRLHGKWEAMDFTLCGFPGECKLRNPRTDRLAPIYKWLDQAPGGLLVMRNDRMPSIVATYLDDFVPITQRLGALPIRNEENNDS